MEGLRVHIQSISGLIMISNDRIRELMGDDATVDQVLAIDALNIVGPSDAVPLTITIRRGDVTLDYKKDMKVLSDDSDTFIDILETPVDPEPEKDGIYWKTSIHIEDMAVSMTRGEDRVMDMSMNGNILKDLCDEDKVLFLEAHEMMLGEIKEYLS